MSETMKEVTTLVLADTVATRKYPFTRQTLDQIQDLRKKREEELTAETGKDHMVPAPVIIAEAIYLMHQDEFGTE